MKAGVISIVHTNPVAVHLVTSISCSAIVLGYMPRIQTPMPHLRPKRSQAQILRLILILTGSQVEVTMFTPPNSSRHLVNSDARIRTFTSFCRVGLVGQVAGGVNTSSAELTTSDDISWRNTPSKLRKRLWVSGCRVKGVIKLHYQATRSMFIVTIYRSPQILHMPRFVQGTRLMS